MVLVPNFTVPGRDVESMAIAVLLGGMETIGGIVEDYCDAHGIYPHAKDDEADFATNPRSEVWGMVYKRIQLLKHKQPA